MKRGFYSAAILAILQILVTDFCHAQPPSTSPTGCPYKISSTDYIVDTLTGEANGDRISSDGKIVTLFNANQAPVIRGHEYTVTQINLGSKLALWGYASRIGASSLSTCALVSRELEPGRWTAIAASSTDMINNLNYTVQSRMKLASHSNTPYTGPLLSWVLGTQSRLSEYINSAPLVGTTLKDQPFAITAFGAPTQPPLFTITSWFSSVYNYYSWSPAGGVITFNGKTFMKGSASDTDYTRTLLEFKNISSQVDRSSLTGEDPSIMARLDKALTAVR